MIIETADAREARDLARALLEAAEDPADVSTVFRGSRLAFSVPDELGRAVGREPDTSEADAPADGSGGPADQSTLDQFSESTTRTKPADGSGEPVPGGVQGLRPSPDTSGTDTSGADTSGADTSGADTPASGGEETGGEESAAPPPAKKRTRKTTTTSDAVPEDQPS